MKNNNVLLILSVVGLSACGGSGGNDAPTFEQTSYQTVTSEDQLTTLNVQATDKNTKDTITYALANASVNAAIDINASTGEISYQPNTNFNGVDSFEISASDGEETAKATINVTVDAVNDIPMLDATEILVSGGEVKKGLVLATDVDGDSVNYQITTTTQNGELTIGETSGEVTYTPISLVDVNDSFTLVITDNNGGTLTKELTIKASLASNADRAYYYYASEQSHLKQAEQKITSLSNDINQGLVFNNLAVGYAQAGLTNQVERLVSEAQIVRDEMRARTLLAVSHQYNSLNILDKGDEYRTQANSAYTQYVASKGISSFDNDDAAFFNSLALGYINTGQAAKADQALSILDLLFSAALEGNNTTSALRTFFSYRNLVDDVIEDWQISNLQTDYDLAHSMVTRLYSYSKLISNRFVSNDRNGNEGMAYYSTRQVALFDVIESYMELNDFGNAREALHDVLALHGVIGIDENYPRTADEYSAVTRIEYPSGLYSVIEQFVVLYPDASLEPYLAGFDPSSFWLLFVEEDAADALLMARVRTLKDKDAALNLVIAAKDPDRLRNHYTNLVSFNSSSPGGAIYLRKQGEYPAAAKFLTEALTLVSSADYVEENLWLESFVTGSCEKILQEFSELYRLTGEAAYNDQAIGALDICIGLAKTHFSDGIDGNDVEISDAIKANSRFLAYANTFYLGDNVSVLVNNIETNIDKIDSADHEELFSRLKTVGMTIALGGDFSDAQAYYDRAIVQLNLFEGMAVNEEVGQITNEFFNDTGSLTDYSDYLAVIDNNSGTLDNYSQIKATAYNAWNTIIEQRLTTLADAANQQKLTYLPSYAEQLMRIGKYSKALELANNSVLGVVEKESIITEVARSLSVKDDFQQTQVASVDTDGDGKVNFFLEIASEDAINNSGLVLDEDSDNDGVNDDTDSYPLDPNKS
ncbi:MAG: hypothetical protein ACJAXS_002793 [Colwellia sp.]|jgi:hypothetical protein